MIGDITTSFFCEFGELGRRQRRRFNETAQSDPVMGAHLVANLAGPDAQPPEMFTAEHVAYALNASASEGRSSPLSPQGKRAKARGRSGKRGRGMPR